MEDELFYFSIWLFEYRVNHISNVVMKKVNMIGMSGF